MSKIRAAFWAFAVTAGFVQAWGDRFYIEPDGVNYLDVADAYLRHDGRSAINGYWSPLYSWLLAGTKWLFRPSGYWESTVLHAVNLVLYLLALVSFEFFFRRLLALLASRFPEAVGEKGMRVWAWWVLGYAGFLLAALRMITVSNDTPDMALAGLLFLASGLLIAIALKGSWLQQALLGIALGAGYLTKSVMFPSAAVYLCASALANNPKKPNIRALAALATFALTSVPFSMALSHARGHLTFGETGSIAYSGQVTHRDTSKLAHPMRRAFENPVVYEYEAVPFVATYPPWYDGSYWNEGTAFRFHLPDQLRAIGRTVGGYFRILSVEKEWVAGWLVLAIFAGEWRILAKRWLALWFVWLPPLAMLAVYALVLVEPRYVGVAMAVVWLSLFSAVPWQSITTAPRVGIAVALAISITTTAALAREQVQYVQGCVRPPPHQQWIAANELRRMGLRPGDRVAVLGHTTIADYWAHLAGLRIAADVPVEEVPSYWAANPEKRATIAATLASLGIKTIVAGAPPIAPQGWQTLADSGYYVRMLQVPGSRPQLITQQNRVPDPDGHR